MLTRHFLSHIIHGIWYIYLDEWLISMVNVGKYTIHGSYGYGKWSSDLLICSSLSTEHQPANNAFCIGKKNYIFELDKLEMFSLTLLETEITDHDGSSRNSAFTNRSDLSRKIQCKKVRVCLSSSCSIGESDCWTNSSALQRILFARDESLIVKLPHK